MAWQVAFTLQASGDLEDIASYIRQESNDAERGEQFSQRLAVRALSLADAPFAHKIYPYKPGVRRLLAGRYYIYYRVLESRKTIVVLRFWHTARRNPPRWAL